MKEGRASDGHSESVKEDLQHSKVQKERGTIEAKVFNPPDLCGVREFLSSTDVRDAYFAEANYVQVSDLYYQVMAKHVNTFVHPHTEMPNIRQP